MDIKDVLKLREDTESRIREFISLEIRAFSDLTDLGVRDVDVHMFEYCIRDEGKNLFAVDRVKLDVRL
jgi:hypothetical protein